MVGEFSPQVGSSWVAQSSLDGAGETPGVHSELKKLWSAPITSSDARIANFTVTLDDGVVFTAPERFVAEDERTVYEHAVAPGHHVVGIDIERFDTRGADYRTWQSSRFSVVIPESQLVDTHLTIVDNSDMADDFPDDQDGGARPAVSSGARGWNHPR